MKTLKLTTLALFVTGVTAAFAGPGPQYWQSRLAPVKTKPAPAAPTACPACSCPSMCHR